MTKKRKPRPRKPRGKNFGNSVYAHFLRDATCIMVEIVACGTAINLYPDEARELSRWLARVADWADAKEGARCLTSTRSKS